MIGEDLVTPHETTNDGSRRSSLCEADAGKKCVRRFVRQRLAATKRLPAMTTS